MVKRDRENNENIKNEIHYVKKMPISGENQNQDKSKYDRNNLMLLPGEIKQNGGGRYNKLITQEPYGM